MEKSTAEQITFIDNYLKNSGVDFLDVRIEMTDHIASAIEREMEQHAGLSFYASFKSYMVHNKKSLLKSAGKHRWSVDLKILKRIGKNLIEPYVIFLMFLFVGVMFVFKIPVADDNLFFLIPFAAIILCGYIVPLVLYYRIKISFLNRMVVVSSLLNYLFFQIKLHSEFSHASLFIFYGLVLWINISVIRSAFQMSNHYKKQYIGI